jgi:hypothetical protein
VGGKGNVESGVRVMLIVCGEREGEMKGRRRRGGGSGRREVVRPGSLLCGSDAAFRRLWREIERERAEEEARDGGGKEGRRGGEQISSHKPRERMRVSQRGSDQRSRSFHVFSLLPELRSCRRFPSLPLLSSSHFPLSFSPTLSSTPFFLSPWVSPSPSSVRSSLPLPRRVFVEKERGGHLNDTPPPSLLSTTLGSALTDSTLLFTLSTTRPDLFPLSPCPRP